MVAIEETFPRRYPADQTRLEPVELYRLKKEFEHELGELLVRAFEEESEK